MGSSMNEPTITTAMMTNMVMLDTMMVRFSLASFLMNFL